MKRPLRIGGWRFLLLNGATGAANVVMLANVPGYTVLAPYAAGSLQGVTPSYGTWATTDHMIGIALGLPLSRWFSGRFGDYRVLISALVGYALFSLMCAASETIWFFAPMRFLLGLAGGVALPLAQSVTLAQYPDDQRTVGVGFWGVMSMAPFTIGVFMGGFWAEYFNWRWLFYSNVAVVLLTATVIAALFYGRDVERRVTRFDAIGFFLLATALIGVQTILNMGNDFDWFASPLLAWLLLVVVFTLPMFIIWEFGERRPALDLRLFLHRNFAIATFCSLIGFLVIQGLLSVFVVQLQVLLGYTSSLAGMVYLTMIFLAMAAAAVVHELTRNVDARLIVFLNFIGLAVTFVWLGQYDKSASFDNVATPMFFFGFSLAMFFAPLATLAMAGLAGERLIRAAEELAMLRTVFGAMGITLLGVVVFRRTPFHQLDLADHFGGRRFASLDLLTSFLDRMQAMGMSPQAARSQAAQLIRQQAAILALNDAFLLGAMAFICLAGIIWFAYPSYASKKREQALERLSAEELMEQP
ncbi:DHA2 family efflux MFS transporter permease subunit [Methylocystis sp. B8]|uniref:DHA2 family efflux MFS transporter permease subunit n=1 Tax=Methylocystis sp. B8 TaxID=544938 RepID=UPI0010FDC8DD|nr:DHA2 family efflux MFS transporter permease subunit [Methylocystis sp. B8]TLG77665.1 DHA2 family efflux MFS transporter permease subunit [Methylocystis sp. B8]